MFILNKVRETREVFPLDVPADAILGISNPLLNKNFYQ